MVSSPVGYVVYTYLYLARNFIAVGTRAGVFPPSLLALPEGSDTLEISYASSEITFEIMKSHTQKKSEITLFENENRKTPYISVNYGRIELRDIINWNITEVI